MNPKLTSSCTVPLLAALVLSVAGCGERGDVMAEMLKGKDVAAEKSGLEQTAKASPNEAGHDNAGQSNKEGHNEEGLVTLNEEELKAAGVRAEKLLSQDRTEQIIVTANIEPNQDRLAHIQPPIQGRVATVDANLGDRVNAGQTLATLDSVELNEAGAAYVQAQSELSLAQANFNRANKLFADKIIPQKDFLSARSEMEKARAAALAAAKKLTLLGVDTSKIGTAGKTLAFPVKSPFPGTVIEKDVVLGDLAEPGKSMFTVADLSILWIETNVFEKDLSKVKEGLSASVAVAAYPGEVFRGRVTYIGGVMDKESRTVKARVEVANDDSRLKPGMFANVALETEVNTGAKVLSVPQNAVVLMQGQTTVFVAKQGGFEPRPVQTGERIEDRVVLQSGVAEGETVVTSGAYALKARILKSQIGEGH